MVTQYTNKIEVENNIKSGITEFIDNNVDSSDYISHLESKRNKDIVNAPLELKILNAIEEREEQAKILDLLDEYIVDTLYLKEHKHIYILLSTDFQPAKFKRTLRNTGVNMYYSPLKMKKQTNGYIVRMSTDSPVYEIEEDVDPVDDMLCTEASIILYC